jgi:threonine synthase
MESYPGFRCSVCGEEYEPDGVLYTCLNDGGNLDVILDYARIRKEVPIKIIEASNERSIWRYLPLLPVDDPGHVATPLRSVGWTPLFRSRRLGSDLGLDDLWIKDDGRNPTASFKDRASAIVIARAQEIGAEVVITASTGNAGAALAGMAAAAQMRAVILAPKTAPVAKVAQLLIFGAMVILVDGTYDQAFDLSIQAADSFGWYCRNTGYNPFTAEGKKTASFEICEQLSSTSDRETESWIAPDAVFVSVGDGNIISGLHKGFLDLITLGWIDKMPRIFGVQSSGSAAIYNAFTNETEEFEVVQADTIADSISVDYPRDGLRALRAATRTDGAYVQVDDEEILVAMKEMAVSEAIFAEPAGATAYAGLVKAKSQNLVGVSDKIVVLNTGSGLKDVDTALQAVSSAKVIKPELSELEAALIATED